MARNNSGSASNYLQATGLSFTRPFTVFAWGKPDSGANRTLLMGDEGDTDSYFYIHLKETSTFVKFTAPAGQEGSITSAVTLGGNWATVGYTELTNSDRRLYVNGANKVSSISLVETSPVTRLRVSAQTGGVEPFVGDFGEIAIWSAGLLDEEHLALGQGFSPLLVRPREILHYWRVLGNVSPEPPERGTISLTLTGTLAQAEHSMRLYQRSRRKIVVPPLALPPTARNPSPVSGSVDAPLTLTWEAPGATQYDVYFGTDNPPATRVLADTPFMSYAPGTLLPKTTYYWKINAINSVGSTTGTVWSFRTPSATALITTISGVTPRVRLNDLSIHDILNEAPNLCSFTVDTTPPSVGQPVKMGLGSLAPSALIFSGNIAKCTEMFDEITENRKWKVIVRDNIYKVNRRKVRKRYAQQSASEIFFDLAINYAPGFTYGHVVSGLPTVTGGIDYTDEELGQAFSRLMARIGGYWYADYSNDFHAFIEEASESPDPLDQYNVTLEKLPEFTGDEDVFNQRTRTYVEGGGSQARVSTPVGATSLQVTDASWYQPSGGVVVSGPQRITYTGKGEVGGPSAPGGSASLIAGNLSAGPYTYKTTQIDAGVETPLSAASSPITIPTVPDPTSAISATNGSFAPPSGSPTDAASAGGSVDLGDHQWAYSFVTASGETTPGPRSSRTIANLSPPNTSGLSVGAATIGGSTTPGTHQLEVTFVNAAGETTPSARNWVSTGTTSLPSGSMSGSVVAGGSIEVVSQLNYWVTFITPSGETTASPHAGGTINIVTAGQQQVNLVSIPTGSAEVTGRKIYRQTGVGSPRLALTINDNTTTTASDTVTNASIAGNATPPGVSTATLQTIPLSNIPIGPAGTTQRKLYLTKMSAPTGTAYLLATLSNNPQAISSSSVASPSVITTVNAHGLSSGNVVTISGHSGSTPALSGPYIITVLTPTTFSIKDAVTNVDVNVTVGGTGGIVAITTYNVTTADASLGVAAPTTNTSALKTVNLTNILAGPSGTTARKIWRTKVSSPTGTLYHAGTISNNTTTTFNDDDADSALGVAAPTVNTAGGSLANASYTWWVSFTTAAGETQLNTGQSATISTGSALLSNVPVSADARVTGRRIYRSVAGGSTPFLEGSIGNNTATTYNSVAADAALTSAHGGTNTTAAGRINVTGIATGGAGVTARKLWRTPSGGAIFKLVATINNNVDTTFADNVSDVSLGEVASGDTISELTGIPSSGPGSILYEILVGDQVNLEVQCDDFEAQADVMAREGEGDGVIEHKITDNRWSYAESLANGYADLALWAWPVRTINYTTRDPKTRSGKTVPVNLPGLDMVGSFVIQSVEISEIGMADDTYPLYSVIASSVRLSFEDVLRRMRTTSA